MLKFQKTTMALLVTMSAIFGHATADAAQSKDSTANYGAPVATAAADEFIHVDVTKKSITVDNGETIRFVVGDKSFTWHFDTLADEPDFDLSAIAPHDIDVGKVHVYVKANPVYRN